MSSVKKLTYDIFKAFNEADTVVVKESYSEELARELFASLIKLGYGEYSILNDGYFVEKFYASSDEEAVKKFYELNHARREQSRTQIHQDAPDVYDTANDGDVIQYTEGVGIKVGGVGIILVEGRLNTRRPIKSEVEALNTKEYKGSLKLAKRVAESMATKRALEAVSLDEIADRLNAKGMTAKNILNKGLNLVADDKQYAVQLRSEVDGQVKVGVAAKQGGRLLDLTTKATPDAIADAVVSLISKVGEPVHKGKTSFLTADEAAAALPVNLTIHLDDDIFTRDYKTLEEAKIGMEKWAYANLEDFEFEILDDTSTRKMWLITAPGIEYTAIATAAASN